MSGLNELEEVFCSEYLVDLDATRAYLRCKTHVTPETAATEAYKILRKPEILTKINQLKMQRVDNSKERAERVVREPEMIAFASFDGLAAWDGDTVTLYGSAEIDPEAMPAIKSIKTFSKNVGTKDEPDFQTFTEIETHDKLRALEMLVRHHGLFNYKLAVQGQVDLVYLTDSKPNKPHYADSSST